MAVLFNHSPDLTFAEVCQLRDTLRISVTHLKGVFAILPGQYLTMDLSGGSWGPPKVCVALLCPPDVLTMTTL